MHYPKEMRIFSNLVYFHSEPDLTKLNELSVLVIVSRSHVRDKYLMLFPSEILMHTYTLKRFWSISHFSNQRCPTDKLLFNLHTLYIHLQGGLWKNLLWFDCPPQTQKQKSHHDNTYFYKLYYRYSTE